MGNQEAEESGPSAMNGGFLPDVRIKRLLRSELFPTDSQPKKDEVPIDNVKSAMYELRLGKEVFISTDKYPKVLREEDDTVVIEPGEFALLNTYEYVRIPDYLIAFISLKFGIAKRGLVNISGFHVDPGFEGHLILSVYNAGPNRVVLKHREPFYMIFYSTLTEKCEKSYGDRPDASFKHLTPRLRAEDIEDVSGPAVSLVKLDAKVGRLSTYVNVLITLVVALVVAVAFLTV